VGTTLRLSYPVLRLAGLPERDRCLVMGILNVTPDSFSDGGAYFDTARAIEHGVALAADGADIVDVGGESTRPGARPVPVSEELSRVLPVVRELARAGVLVSIDTMHACVAQAALDARAGLVNDVSGGLADPVMAATVAAAGVPYVAMHWRAPSREMNRHAVYRDVVAEVAAELRRRVGELVAQGVRETQILLDPGLGFAKRPAHDWALLAHLGELRDLGFPLLIGPPGSRSSALRRGTATGGRYRQPPGTRAARPFRRSPPQAAPTASGSTTCPPAWRPYGWPLPGTRRGPGRQAGDADQPGGAP
jgi:dihydropteroate synthase